MIEKSKNPAELRPLPQEFHEPTLGQVLEGDNPCSGGGSSGGIGAFQPFKKEESPDSGSEPPSEEKRPPHLV